MKWFQHHWEIVKRDNCTCQICGIIGKIKRLTAEGNRIYHGVYNEENVRFEIDHIVPRSLGGSDEITNLRLLCRFCNRSRGNNVNYG